MKKLVKQLLKWAFQRISFLAFRLGFIIKRRHPVVRRDGKKSIKSGLDVTSEKLMDMIHGQNIYDGFPYQDYPLDLHGWGSESPSFLEIFQTYQPRFIIEVGTWKGASAITMASILKKQQIQGVILCIDTWLGAIEFWENQEDLERFKSLKCRHGFPRVYYTFLANVCHTGHQDTIVPFPLHSSSAALWLIKQGIQADAIYIDASHEEEDVYQDVTDYYGIVKKGGIIFGDDWSWVGVRNAVTQFASENGLKVELMHDKWVLRN